eukprot:TRINITY_DN12073_c0_g1_i2.p1 TRINITY_DN12073_c0_g1~~TRINITY_DN12073_c0_g1_i2.p1  ORF type:complete len:242 (+),score=55.84 TRINITY_DN12073_c0_g1_i2:478-1203(+)
MCRIRGLLYKNEYDYLQKLCGIEDDESPTSWITREGGCCCWRTYGFSSERKLKLPMYGLHLMREAVQRSVFGGAFPERCLNLFEKDLHGLQLIYTAMIMKGELQDPMNYVQLARWMLLLFVLLFPWQIDAAEGMFMNVFFPTIVAIIFFAMDAISVNFTDPHGDDVSDIKILPPLHGIEGEMMMMLHERDDPAWQAFCCRHVPLDDAWLRPRRAYTYLCLRSELDVAQAEEQQVRSEAWGD